MLKNILAITGKPGLYQLVSRGNNMLIVESLVDKKRMPSYARDKVVSLAEVSMFTTGEDIALSEVLTKLGKKEGLKKASIDAKKADNDQLRAYFGEVLEDFDRDRVYPSDIRKLITWYNILIEAGITDFSLEEEETAEADSAKAEKKEEAENGGEKKPAKRCCKKATTDSKKEVKKAAPKTQKKTTGATAKTGVGARKG